MPTNNKCVTCTHNLNKAGLDCETACAGAAETKTDSNGIVFVTSCDDYQRDGTI